MINKTAFLGRILAIDPGSPDLGVALYEQAQLVLVSWIKVKRPPSAKCPACLAKQACRHGVEPGLVTTLCDEIERAIGILGKGHSSGLLPDVLVAEVPYFASRFGGGTSISKLAMTIGALVDRASAWRATAYCFNPSEWKGTRPKQDHQADALSCLSERDLDMIPKTAGPSWKFRSDAVDAVCLGEWWLRRGGVRPIAQPLRSAAALRARLQAPR